MKRWFKRKRFWVILFILIYASIITYHQLKPLPNNIAYRGESHIIGIMILNFYMI